MSVSEQDLLGLEGMEGMDVVDDCVRRLHHIFEAAKQHLQDPERTMDQQKFVDVVSMQVQTVLLLLKTPHVANVINDNTQVGSAVRQICAVAREIEHDPVELYYPRLPPYDLPTDLLTSQFYKHQTALIVSLATRRIDDTPAFEIDVDILRDVKRCFVQSYGMHCVPWILHLIQASAKETENDAVWHLSEDDLKSLQADALSPDAETVRVITENDPTNLETVIAEAVGKRQSPTIDVIKVNENKLGGSTMVVVGPITVETCQQIQLLRQFLTPNQQVRETYFTGVRGFGKLCGTTDPLFRPDANVYQPASDGTWVVGKRLATIGRHRIVPHFPFGKCASDGDLPSCLMSAIKESGLPVNSFDVLRIGDATLYDQQLPVKLLVKVQPGVVSWAAGTGLAYACYSELRRFGLHDVHCEVLEARVRTTAGNNSLASSPLPDPTTSRPPFFWPIEEDWDLPWRLSLLAYTPILGQCISPCDLPHKMGSTGFYLRVCSKADQRNTNYLLTCRHVVMDDEDHACIDLVNKQGSDREKPRRVIQPGNHEEIMKQLDVERNALQTKIRILEEKEIAFDDLKPRERTHLTKLKHANTRMEAFLAHDKNITNNRAIGHVIASPPITARDLYRRDWAAIEIDKTKFPTIPENGFCVAPLPTKIREDLRATGETSSIGYESEVDILNVTKYITMNILRTMLQEREYEGNAKSPVVLKSGFETGTTAGYVNEISSYTKSDLSSTYSPSLCILPQDKEVFGACGDSGSLISLLCQPTGINMRPVVAAAGLLWGGCEGIHDVWDITYAIPVEYILDDVKRALGGDVEIDNLTEWDGA
ncbi:hypothetical protein F4861DRAFT_545464 [Xylaria intraflava]|nr:hypothetical protein F4861DRAFT_545464 [Xylaria intraflava]